MLIFPLKKQWYEKIKSGEKKIEYREVKPYWKSRLWKASCLPGEITPYDYEEVRGCVWPVSCYLQLGYNPNTRLHAPVIRFVDVQKYATLGNKEE